MRRRARPGGAGAARGLAARASVAALMHLDGIWRGRLGYWRRSGGFVGRADQEGMWPWLTGRRRLRSDLIWPVPLAVVAISSVEGGRPEVRWSDLEICHLVPVVSREDIVAGEN